MKKIIKIGVSAVAAISMVATLAFSACGHEHVYRDKWSQNSLHHWKEAICEHTDEVTEKGEHVWSEGVKDGDYIVYECECGVIRKHSHDYATAWSSDETNHWHDAVCNHEGEVVTDLQTDLAAHVWVEGETEGDNVALSCETCGATSIHTHTYEEEFTTDKTHHWFASSCEHTTLKKDYAEHNWDEGVTNGDVLTYTCIDCELANSHTHTYAENYTYNETNHWYVATCEHTELKKGDEAHVLGDPVVDAEGNTTRSCECGYEYMEGHTHEIATTWSYDDLYHWYAASCGMDSHKQQYEAHNWGSGVVDGNTITYTCTCGATSVHTHTFESAWSKDETQHWHKSDCGHDVVSEKADHNYNEGVVDGDYMVYTCKDCEYSYSEILAVAKEYVFEAEHTNLQGVMGAGYSSNAENEGLIAKDYYDTADASNDCFIAGLNANGTALTFIINSDKAVNDAKLVVRLSAEFVDPLYFTDTDWLIEVNGVKMQYGDIEIEGAPTDIAIQWKLAFDDFLIATNVSLKQGENIIKLITNNNKPLAGAMYATAPMVDCIKITTTATLSMKKYNEEYISNL